MIRRSAFLQALPYALLLLLCLGLLVPAYLANDSHMVYPLDDTYIHLSLAKQLATEGSWGLSPGRFQSADSSLLYALLLAGSHHAFGLSSWWPLLLNLLAALGLIRLMDRALVASLPRPYERTLALVGLVLLLPLHLLVLCGMEHSWQLLISLLFAGAASEALASRSPQSGLRLLVLGLLCTAIRYEGLFLIGGASFLLLCRRQAWLAAGTLLAGLSPVLTYGVISVQQGAYFLPNSIMSKGHSPFQSPGGLAGWSLRGVEVVYENPFVWLMLLVLGGLVLGHWLRASPFPASGFLALITLMAMVVHVFFAEVGGYRYEAYLVLLTLVALLQAAPLLLREHSGWWQQRSTLQRLGLGAWLALLLFPLLLRTAFFSFNYVRATQNIYQQQFQMAQFLQQHYPQASVAANDVGAITFFTDIQLLDLVGIGGQEVIPAIRRGQYTPAVVDSLFRAHQVELAVIYDHWVGGLMPSSWTRVARWRIPHNFICAGDTVSFYAPPSRIELLRERLQQFQPQLPEEVEVLDGH